MRSGTKRWICFPALAAVPLLFLSLWSSPVLAGHDIGQSCYNCHNIKAGTTWPGSYSIWTGRSIGMAAPTAGKPIACDVCHVDHGRMFDNTALGGSEKSAHPVAIVNGSAMTANFPGYGTQIRCLDCHKGNTVTSLPPPDLNPDVAPDAWDNKGINTGYPNHDILSPNNNVSLGDPPHLTLSTAVYNSYDNTPGTAGADSDGKYGLCFLCHTAAGSISRASGKTIQADYQAGGHYFKSGTWAGKVMPCSDCHGSHRGPDSSRLMDPNLSTGSWPAVVYANPASPSSSEIRAMCTGCHDDSLALNNTPKVRNVEPSFAPTTVSDHISFTGTKTYRACTDCHNPHNPPAGGPECLTCHTSGGSGGSRYDYIDAMFKGVGSDNTANQPTRVGSLIWSQHGGFVSVGGAARFVYTSPYNTKATNDCFKCHGDRHRNTNALIDADNTDSYAYNQVLGMDDNTAAGITNANNFCVTCHDGNGAAADVQIGNVAPPNVAANYATGGHGRPQASGAYTVSLNNPAYLKCTDCHEVHGSNHAKLLPAKKNEATTNFTIPSNFPEKTFRSGGSTLLASTIDFTDYSSPASGKGYGTTGDPGDQRNPAGASTGLCDACHRFAGRANRGTDNVTNQAHTHEGIIGDANQSSPSQMTFTKDCLECHDTHGTTNLEMVDTTINGLGVAFTARTGVNSFDPVEAGSNPNVNSVCVVCHQNSTENPALNVAHNFRTSTVNPDHNEDTNCATCHPHGNSADTKKFGFPQAACNSCHGASIDSTGMPGVSPADTGVYDTDANNPIGTRGGAGNDNTGHKIHVNYLVNKRGVAAASACYVCHKGGGAQEAGGHPGNPANQSYKTGTRPTAVPYVQVAMDNTGAVLNVWNGAGTGPTYSGAPGAAADNTNGWKTCANTKCHYALSPSWSGKQQVTAPPGTMTVSTPDALPAAGSVGQGTTNNVVDKIRLQTNASGMVTDNQFKVRLLAGSTAQNATDIAKVAFWDDVDNDNTVSAGDVQIGGSAVFNGTDNGYTVAPVSYSVVASTTRQILVVVDLAAGAVNGRTMTFSTVNGDIKASYGSITAWTTFNSNQFSVAAPGTLTVSTPDALPAAGPVMVGAGNNVVDKINLVASGGYAAVTGLKVKELGTAQDVNDIANITFWRDVNANGTLEPGTDTILGGAATFSAVDNTYSVTGLSLTVNSGSTERILVVDNVAAGATTTRTIQTQVVDATYVTLSAGTIAGTFPIAASSVQTISSGGQLTVTTPDALPALGDIRGASDNNVVDKILLTAASANVVVSGLWVKELGTSVDVTDIASVSFVDNTGGANTLLGTATYNAGDTTYRLTGLGLTVVVGTPRTILVRANIANGAVAARTVQTQVLDSTYVQVSAGTVNAITSFSSTVQTIRALTAVIVTDTAGSTTPVVTTSLGASGTHQFYATATYSNAALNQNVTTSSAWSRAGTATGSTVGASTGLYTAGSTAGTDNVMAVYRGQSDNTAVVVGVPFAATTYYATVNSGTTLWTGRTTNVTSGTNKTTTNDWTTAVKSGQSTTSTTYRTFGTAAVTAYTAVYNTATAAGSNTYITAVTFQTYVLKTNAGDRLQLQLIAFSSTGVETILHDTTYIDPLTTVGTTQLYTYNSPALSVQVPDGYKIGMRVNYDTVNGSGMTVTLARTTGSQNTQFTITGNNSTGAAPAPPRDTGGGTAIACNTCHQFGPNDEDETTGATGTPGANGIPDINEKTTYTNFGQYSYRYTGSHIKHGVGDTGTPLNPSAATDGPACVPCHGSGVTTYPSDHMGGAINLANGAIGYGTGTGSYTPGGGGHNGTCSNVNCHNNTVTPAWGTGATTCTSCHNNGTNDGNISNAWPNTGKHPLHAAQSPTGYGYACARCHPDNTGGHSTIDGSAQVTFAGNFVAGGTYDAGRTCSSTYCHSTARGANSPNVAMAWNGGGASTAACGTCHGNTAAAGDNTNKAMPVTATAYKHTNHINHVNITSITCSDCHYSASGSNGSYGDKTRHAQGSINNPAIRPAYGYENTVATYTAGGSANTGTCANVLCHNGVATPVWNTGTFTCGACHAIPPTDNGTRGSHAGHATTQADCDACHTGTSSYTVSGPAGNHQNLAVNLSFNGGLGAYSDTNGRGGVNYATGSQVPPIDDGTCSSTGCHGTATPQWGGTLSGGCAACHLGSGDVDDFGTGTAASMFSTGGSAITARVDNTEWLYSGHGKPSGTYDVSLHPAANFGRNASPNAVSCLYCHDGSSSHRDPANPFRLANNNWQSHGWNGNCLICHSKSTPVAVGYDPDNSATIYALINTNIDNSARVDTAHYGSKHAAGKNGGTFCWDCHDPHGDRLNGTTGNIFMIGKKVTRQSDGTYGIPSGGNDNSNRMTPTFTAAATGTDYARATPGPYTGICQVCHDATVSHYTSTSGDTHNATTRCTSCHTHGSNFEARCVDCHDNNGAKVVPAPLVVWSGGARPSPPAGVTAAGFGSHLVALKTDSITGATDWNAQCGKCHNGHSGPVVVPLPPTSWTDPSGRLTGTNMQTRLGIDYAANGGIHLGGTSTTGATEAEICWNCHDLGANSVSEWGYNTKMTPTGFPVVTIAPTNGDAAQQSHDYGYIYTDNNAGTRTSNWVTGGAGGTNPVHKNAYDNATVRLSKKIVSVHSVSFDTAGQSSSVANNVDGTGNVRWTTAVLEGVQYLRCSYCHDIHDLNKAAGPPADNTTGKPFLRAAWVGNPYPVDLPPRTGDTYPTTGGPTTLGNRAFTQQTAMPRYVADSSTANSSRGKGGFFIDQNSGNPSSNAAMNTLDKVAGLCELCHGATVNTMDFYTGSKLWRTVSTNGHANSTIGGTGTGKANLFDASRGTIVTTFTSSNQGQHGMGNQDLVAYGSPGNPIPESNSVPWAGYFNNYSGNRVRNSGWFGGTNMGGTVKGGGDYTTWYTTANGIGSYTGTAGGKAHNFTCSKCHTPHAEGLPALLITNCLDKTQATWSATTRGGVNTVGPNASPAARQARANNCHRKETGGTDNTGWIRLAPAQRF